MFSFCSFYNGTRSTYGYDNANRLTSVNGQSYTWDNNGNLVSDGLLTYSYDQANRLKQVTQGANTYTFAYNGVGDRLSQTVGITTTHYVVDPAAGLTQVLSDGTNAYVYGNGRLAQYQAEMQYFGADGLGSVRQLYDATGQVITNNRYDPYGNLMSQYGTATSIFGYTGEQWDSATGLEYLRARYYSSAQGRFFQRDLWPGDDLRPQSLNAYSYVGNNVITYADPSGRCYGQLEGIRKLPVEDSLCGYLDMSIAVLNSPTATDNEKRLAGAYVGGYGVSHAYLALGGVMMGAGAVEGVAGWGASYLYPAATGAAANHATLAMIAKGAGGALVGLNVAADVGLVAKALTGDQDAQMVLAAAYQASGYMPFQSLPAVWSYLSRMKFFQFGIPCPQNLIGVPDEFAPWLSGGKYKEWDSLPTSWLRFGQKTFGRAFTKGPWKNMPVQEVAAGVKNGAIKLDYPFKVFLKTPEMDTWGARTVTLPSGKVYTGSFSNLEDWQFYTLNNKGLAMANMAGVENVPVTWASDSLIMGQSFQFSTPNLGTSAIQDVTGITVVVPK